MRPWRRRLRSLLWVPLFASLAATPAAASFSDLWKRLAGEALRTLLVGPGPCPCAQVPDSPRGLVQRFECVYRNGCADAYADLLSEDFRFHFGTPEEIERYPRGWGRADEIVSARNLFLGGLNRLAREVKPAIAIRPRMEPSEVLAHPAKPDSFEHYRIVWVPAVHLALETEAGELRVDGQPHEFWLVRGDAARLAPGRVPSRDRWYVYKWVERAPHLLASTAAEARAEEAAPRSGDSGPRADSTGSPRPPAYALGGVESNPTAGEATFTVTLAGTAVSHLVGYDLRGSRRLVRSVGHLGPGVHRLQLRLADRLAPGTYWFRLVPQATEPVRVVVLD